MMASAKVRSMVVSRGSGVTCAHKICRQRRRRNNIGDASHKDEHRRGNRGAAGGQVGIRVLGNNSGPDGVTRPMAHYFFHFHGADQPDHTGTELASAQAARDAAVIFMGERLKDLDGGFWPDAEWSIRVVDETGAAVCAIQISGN